MRKTAAAAIAALCVFGVTSFAALGRRLLRERRALLRRN